MSVLLEKNNGDPHHVYRVHNLDILWYLQLGKWSVNGKWNSESGAIHFMAPHFYRDPSNDRMTHSHKTHSDVTSPWEVISLHWEMNGTRLIVWLWRGPQPCDFCSVIPRLIHKPLAVEFGGAQKSEHMLLKLDIPKLHSMAWGILNSVDATNWFQTFPAANEDLLPSSNALPSSLPYLCHWRRLSWHFAALSLHGR